MSDFAARISRVRMKDGASVTILPTPMGYGDPEQPENWRGKVVQHAKQIAENDEAGSRLDGFVVIGLYDNGTSSIGFRLPERIPRSLVPAYIAEIIRRDAITEPEAARVFDDHFQWVE